MKLVSIIILIFACALPIISYSLDLDDSLVEIAIAGKSDQIKEAINQGKDVDTVNANKSSLLLVAASQNNVELLKFLLNAGADPNLSNSDNATPLYAASMLGYEKVVEILLKHGADPDIAMNKPIATPLMSAAINGRVEIVKLLIRYKASCETRNAKGQTVFEMISETEQPVISSILKKLNNGT